MNSNSFVRVQEEYFIEFKFEFGKMIEFFRVRVRNSALPVVLDTAVQSLHTGSSSDFSSPSEDTKPWNTGGGNSSECRIGRIADGILG